MSLPDELTNQPNFWAILSLFVKPCKNWDMKYYYSINFEKIIELHLIGQLILDALSFNTIDIRAFLCKNLFFEVGIQDILRKFNIDLTTITRPLCGKDFDWCCLISRISTCFLFYTESDFSKQILTFKINEEYWSEFFIDHMNINNFHLRKNRYEIDIIEQIHLAVQIFNNSKFLVNVATISDKSVKIEKSIEDSVEKSALIFLPSEFS